MKKTYNITFLAILAGLMFATDNLVAEESGAIEVVVEEKNTTDSSNNTIMKRPETAYSSYEYDKRYDYVQPIVDVDAALTDAMKVHNFASNMLDNLASVEAYKNIIRNYEYSENVLKLNENCNIGLLSPYYHDPKDVWSKMSTWAYNTEKAGVARMDAIRDDIIAGANESGINYYNNPNFMPKNMILTRNSWDIGNRVLSDVYGNQSKWGKKKHPFPLWEDQKYLYDSEWNRKYGEIKVGLVRAYTTRRWVGTREDGYYVCSTESWVHAVPNKGPEVKELYKYDHEDFDPKLGTQAVLKAHNEYLKLIKKRPAGLNFSVMHTAPKQLPPVKEAVFQFMWNASNDMERNFTAYPGLPNVWKTFINSNFVFFNQGREDHFYNPVKMPDVPDNYCPKIGHANALGDVKYGSEIRAVTNYTPSSLARYTKGTRDEPSRRILPDAMPSNVPRIVKERFSFRNDVESTINNRVQTYLDNRLYKETLEPLAEEAKVDIVEFVEYLKAEMNAFGIVVKDDFDISNASDYEALIAQLKIKRDEHLGEARKIFDTIPPTEEDLLPQDMIMYKKFIEIFDMFNLDTQMVTYIDQQSYHEVPEKILEANAEIVSTWDTIKMLREAPTYPKVGCPIY